MKTNMLVLLIPLIVGLLIYLVVGERAKREQKEQRAKEQKDGHNNIYKHLQAQA